MVFINLLAPVNEEANAVPFGICHSFGEFECPFWQIAELGRYKE